MVAVIDAQRLPEWRLPRRQVEPHSDTPIGRLMAAIDDVVAEPLSPVSGGHADDLRALFRGINRLEADAARRLLPFDTNREFEAEQEWSTVAFLRNACGLAHAAASARLEIARRVPELPQTWEAFRRGDVGVTNATTVAQLVTAVGAEVALASDQMLADTASDYRPEMFRRVAGHIRHCLDADGAAAEADAQFERRSLYLSQTLGGAFVLKGTLDAEGGAILKAALEAIMPAAREQDRTPAQRRADAAVEAGRFVLRYCDDLPTWHGEPAQVTMLVAQSTLEGREGVPAAELVWAGVVPAEIAQRLACDAVVSTVTLDEAGTPVDSGPASRVIAAPLWRALVARDRGCVVCGLAPCWTDAHHRIPREHGGPTVLKNLELRCRRHHRIAHGAARKARRSGARSVAVVPSPSAFPAKQRGIARSCARHAAVWRCPRSPCGRW